MTSYEIPAEPDTDRVWTTDPETGRPIQWNRGSSGRWTNANNGGWHPSWRSLLSVGPVTDVDPDDVSWLPPGPLIANMHGEVVNGDGEMVFDTGRSNAPLAALIARLVNEHVARRAEGGS